MELRHLLCQLRCNQFRPFVEWRDHFGKMAHLSVFLETLISQQKVQIVEKRDVWDNCQVIFLCGRVNSFDVLDRVGELLAFYFFKISREWEGIFVFNDESSSAPF